MASKYSIIGLSPGVLSLGTPKVASVLLLCNILNPGRLHRTWLWFLVSTLFICLSLCIVLTWTRCVPAEAVYIFDLPGANCANPKATLPFVIFTGGTLPHPFHVNKSYKRLLKLTLLSSLLGFCRHLPRRLPCNSAVEHGNVLEKEACS